MDRTRTAGPDARAASAVDRLAEEYLEHHLALDPLEAAELGVAGHERELPDLSPDGLAERSALRRRTLAALDALAADRAGPAMDPVDLVTVAALRERLSAAEGLREIGADAAHLNNLNSPLQQVRQVFDLMPSGTAEDWPAIRDRLASVPAALDGYAASLRLASGRPGGPARRQVEAGAAQCERFGAPDGPFAALADRAAGVPGMPPSLVGEVRRAAAAAAAAYTRLGTVLATELHPAATSQDGVGAERYLRFARWSLGTTLDLDETYAWAQAELDRIDARMRAVAERIVPGGGVAEAMRALREDPARRLSGAPALRAWMQRTADAAIDALAGRHFDIPEPVRRIDCQVTTARGVGISYTGPSEDFSRPGRVWWGIPAGATEFSTWQEVSTVYHEGVPGHHLQVAQTVYRRDTLNRWRRLAWVDGHGEGWALYAERLMAELGFLDDPGDLLGMLASQAFRAVRVVIDVGWHAGLPAPAAVGGGPWTYDAAWRLLGAHSVKSEERLRFELDRYLGVPAQASSYKIGERVWLRLREEARARAARADRDLDLAAFHRSALDIGGVGLDVLRAAVLGDLAPPAADHLTMTLDGETGT